MARRPNEARDLRVAEYRRRFVEKHGFEPTQRQIMRTLRLSSLSLVQRSLSRLHDKAQRQALTQSSSSSSQPTIPLVGRVAAGSPIEAIENQESREVPPWMMKKNKEYFLLQVRGTSMIEDGIFHDDLVLIRKESTARNGERVVALIDNQATLKIFYKKPDHILLKAANAAFKDIRVSTEQDFRIAGIFAGVLRRAD